MKKILFYVIFFITPAYGSNPDTRSGINLTIKFIDCSTKCLVDCEFYKDVPTVFYKNQWIISHKKTNESVRGPTITFEIDHTLCDQEPVLKTITVPWDTTCQLLEFNRMRKDEITKVQFYVTAENLNRPKQILKPKKGLQ